MVRKLAVLWTISAMLLFSGCSRERQEEHEEPWEWELPAGFPTPRVPEFNPMTVAKVELGEVLFFDERLSRDQNFSCASCHRPELAFTDGKPRAVGSTGEVHHRGTMSLVNAAYFRSFNWADPTTETLEEQVLVPLFGEDPVEMGLSLENLSWLERFREDPKMVALFSRAFPEYEEPIDVETIAMALASFQRSLVFGDSPLDRFLSQGDSEALSAEAQRGMALFFSERLECFHCHGGFNFSDDVDHEGVVFREPSFHNTGLYNIDFRGGYPPENQGLFEHTGRPEDMGRFKAPSLRNIAITAPYMHDGSIETLEEVIDHYAAGGRRIHEGPYAGDGSLNPYKSLFLVGFRLNAQERADLLAFLTALTDEAFQ